MSVIARDAVASDHLVYAWPFPIGPECEVSCGDDEQVVMCPAWMVGDRLGPGRHHWRTPDPTRPVSAYFVLTSPVEVSFDMSTMFMIPTTGQPVRIRAAGSLQVRCGDPGLLIAQFVGLPFDHVNDGILRSVSRSIERMLARLLTRRVVMAGVPHAVTDPAMHPSILEELVAYNPAAGAVFGVEMIRMGHLTIAADDGSTPYLTPPPQSVDWSGGHPRLGPNGDTARQQDIPLLETVRGVPPAPARHQSVPPVQVSGEIQVRSPAASGEIDNGARANAGVPVPTAGDDITQPGLAPVRTPNAGSRGTPPGAPVVQEARGAILGIGVGHIGSAVSGEIPMKVAPGGRVLVPGPNGLMQSATVRQLLQGYYELEVGSSGETIWVPISGVVPE